MSGARARSRVRAFAKINLTLRVLGVRADGYHELRTTFQSLALHDTLTFTPRRGPFRLDCDDPALSGRPDESGLARGRAAVARGRPARRAARRRACASTSGFRCRPGSAAAAATRPRRCARCARLWRVDADATRVCADRRATLGADVPFFLEGGTALGLDRGDRLFPLDRSAALRGSCSCCRPSASARRTRTRGGIARMRRRGEPAPAAWRCLPGSGVATTRATISKRRSPRVIPRSRAIVARSEAAGRAGTRRCRAAARPCSACSPTRRAARRRPRPRCDRPPRRAVVTRTHRRRRRVCGAVARPIGAPTVRLAASGAHRIHLPFAPRGFGHS